MDPEEKRHYDRFRTGFTFREVRQMLWVYSEDRTTWPDVTRRTVLGKWHEIKKAMWQEFLNQIGGPSMLGKEKE